ncbi:MAG: DUF4440 domain-containing protein [Acidobacteria bacterium]|nr:DUF4440 domain-containing protein [Acidobacteriota bacterium]
MRSRAFAFGLVLSLFAHAGGAAAQRRGSPSDERKSEAQIRKALADWVEATNRGDDAAANSIWADKMIGWFPRAPEFGLSGAFAAAGLPEKKEGMRSTYELKIDEVVVSGSVASVYDIWTETAHFDGSPVTVGRVIRGNELWRRQPDGKWKIARFVSAPEKWEKVPWRDESGEHSQPR